MLYTVLLTQVKPTLQQDNYLPRETKHLLLSTQRHHCSMLEILSTSLVWLTVMYFKHLANSVQHPPFLIVTATVQLWNMQYLHSPITSFNMCTAVKDDGVTLDESLFLFSFFSSLSPPLSHSLLSSKCVLNILVHLQVTHWESLWRIGVVQKCRDTQFLHYKTKAAWFQTFPKLLKRQRMPFHTMVMK